MREEGGPTSPPPPLEDLRRMPTGPYTEEKMWISWLPNPLATKTPEKLRIGLEMKMKMKMKTRFLYLAFQLRWAAR